MSVNNAVIATASSSTPNRDGRNGTIATGSGSGPSLASSSRPPVFSPSFLQRHSYPSNPTPVPSNPISFPSDADSEAPDGKLKRLALSCSTTAWAIDQISKVVSRAIFHLSASNWPLVLGRIKSRLSYLTTTIEPNPDLVDLHLLQWANLNEERLGQLIQGISSVFSHVKRPAQIAVADGLRKAIWNWIHARPGEYEVLVESNHNLQGEVDTFFDTLHSMSDITSAPGARRVRAFYPLMAMLLVISPDTLKRVCQGDAARSHSEGLGKKLSFVDSVRKGLTSNRAFGLCAVGHVEFLRAAMYTPPKLDNSAIRRMMPDVHKDLTVGMSPASQLTSTDFR